MATGNTLEIPECDECDDDDTDMNP